MFEKNKALEEQYRPLVGWLLGAHHSRYGTEYEDQTLHIDVLNSEYKAGSRLRRERYAEDYYRHFTLSDHRDRTGRTEYDAVVKGHVNRYFTGLVREDEEDRVLTLLHWRILDMDVFRLGLRLGIEGELRKNAHDNKGYWVYRYQDFVDDDLDFVLCSGDKLVYEPGHIYRNPNLTIPPNPVLQATLFTSKDPHSEGFFMGDRYP